MGIRSPGVFSTLPPLFFSPLASPNKAHYAAMLVQYFRLFQESPHGIERKVLVGRFAAYIDAHYGQFEAEEAPDETESADTPMEEPAADPTLFTEAENAGVDLSRYLAARSIRIFVNTGWMSEETLPDYTRVINMATHARPFLEALARVDEGLKVEYESHVVSVYSLLCGDAARDNGHYMVLNAHAQTIALIDSLKILSQSIREHYERLTDESGTLDVAEILALHYDNYASDILDGAYKRLKTSDNLSRYRPRILAQVRDFLLDTAWLENSSVKYARTASVTVVAAREKMTAMLEEIRDILKAVDPLLEEIDRRNMLYAKSSVERVKTLLEPASSITGRIMAAVERIRDTPGLHEQLSHHLYRVAALTPESRYTRWLRESLTVDYAETDRVDPREFEKQEAEFRLRMEKQLSPVRIVEWLGERFTGRMTVSAAEIANTTDDFVRLVYALLYAESRGDTFPFTIEEDDRHGMTASRSLWLVPDVTLRRKA